MTALEKIQPGRGQRGSWFLVRVNGELAGLITKQPNTRDAKHPWKAFLGFGEAQKFIGAFYTGMLDAEAAITNATFTK